MMAADPLNRVSDFWIAADLEISCSNRRTTKLTQPMDLAVVTL